MGTTRQTTAPRRASRFVRAQPRPPAALAALLPSQRREPSAGPRLNTSTRCNAGCTSRPPLSRVRSRYLALAGRRVVAGAA